MTAFHTPTIAIPRGPWASDSQVLQVLPEAYTSCSAEDFFLRTMGNKAPVGVQGTVTYVPHNDHCIAQVSSCRFRESVYSKAVTTKSWLGIHFILRGESTSVIDGYGQLNYSGPRLTFGCSAQPVRVVSCTLAERNVDDVSFIVNPQYLVEQFGIKPDQLPATIQAMLNGTDGSYFNQSLPLSPSMMRALEDLTASHYTGKLQETFAKIKTMELLFLAIEALIKFGNTAPTITTLGDYDIDLLHQARNILDDLYATPPTLSELGRHIGMNRNKLSQGFKELFGSGAYEYCQQLRMQQAMILLQKNRLSLLQIAERIGYQNQSSFTRAYKNFYGHTPSLEKTE